MLLDPLETILDFAVLAVKWNLRMGLSLTTDSTKKAQTLLLGTATEH